MTNESGQRITELLAEAADIEAELGRVSHELAKARRRYYREAKAKEDQKEMGSLESEARLLVARLEPIESELLKIAKIPIEVIEAIEADAIDVDEESRMERASLSEAEMPPTVMIEDHLPNALEIARDLVDASWLEEERKASWRLDASFLTEPFLLTGGVQIACEERAIHRFAQTICVAEDYMNGHPRYDFNAGALLVPQLAAFGAKYDALAEVSGDTQKRIATLWKGPSSSADATMFELLVAASCVRKGREIEFLPASQEKTPDMRVHGYTLPMVLECKRQATMSEYERREENVMRALFCEVANHVRRIGLWGSFEFDLTIEADTLDIAAAAGAAVSQRLAPDPTTPTQYDWGQVAYHELTPRVAGPTTRLYSPQFLQGVFGWNPDIPQHDGIVCQVTADDFVVDTVTNPIALLWRNMSEESLKKRSWTPVALYGSAAQQIPGGEVGISYVSYREGTRAEVADRRTRWIIAQLREFWHEPSIRIPVCYLIRLYPRALGEGEPDLVENAMYFKSAAYGDDVYFADFPGAVFTSV